METLLKIEEREIYPLVEIEKIERTEITETIASLLHEWIKKKVVGMYADEDSTLESRGDHGRGSLWGVIDVLAERGARIRIGRCAGHSDCVCVEEQEHSTDLVDMARLPAASDLCENVMEIVKC